ncbi:MAG: hypothetical protein ACK559_23495, partial [bacterium]
MRHAVVHVVVRRHGKDLGLVLEPPERAREEHAIEVPFERGVTGLPTGVGAAEPRGGQEAVPGHRVGANAPAPGAGGAAPR